MDIHTYLLQHRESCPTWLKEFKVGDKFNKEQFFGSRFVYYPGHGRDGHPVKLFGSSHSAHCFIYVDYMVDKAAILDSLTNQDPRFHRRFKGYNTIERLHLSQADLVPDGWKPNVTLKNQSTFGRDITPFTPFGFLEVLERDAELDDLHGASRLAVLFLGADGIATYDALFCQPNKIYPPFAVLIQDHGWGGNYDKFGKDGLLEQIASHCQVFPQFLLVADGTQQWHEYTKISGVDGECGGMHRQMRCLFSQTMHRAEDENLSTQSSTLHVRYPDKKKLFLAKYGSINT